MTSPFSHTSENELLSKKYMSKAKRPRPLLVEPNEGRKYDMGRMKAVFKADLEETDSTLSVSEWWLEANSEGPEIHEHPESHVFYVIEGTITVYLEGKDWFEIEKGSYVYIPGGFEHGFENRSAAKAGFISFNTPGGFEKTLPFIVAYFKEQPLGKAVSEE